MKFVFTNEFKASKIDEIVNYIAGPRLWIPQIDYPNYTAWLDKVYYQIQHESKRAMIAFFERQIVGVIIYQKHESKQDCLEIKNMTIRPDIQGRYIASFLWRNVEIEGSREYKCTKVVCDAKAHNFQIQAFLLRHHYKISNRSDLYQDKSGDDFVYEKKLTALIWT